MESSWTHPWFAFSWLKALYLRSKAVFAQLIAHPAAGLTSVPENRPIAQCPRTRVSDALTSKERDPDTTAFILKRFPKSNPSVVHADFDGDGNLDYALLLKNDKSQAAKLVVLLCSGTSHCRSVYELDVTADSGIVYLRPVATGSVVSQTEAIDSTTAPSPAKLHSTGIQVTYFEKAAVVLYWDRKLKKIREVQTAD